jgi:hypothetical protein
MPRGARRETCSPSSRWSSERNIYYGRPFLEEQSRHMRLILYHHLREGMDGRIQLDQPSAKTSFAERKVLLWKRHGPCVDSSHQDK